eukprot:TRINITY_DN5559_c0_g1_i2.p1 TRINITY_DN5559_c0_g1~~TRINITY_DN5559_c0_g1_i2.p1  ORF type:complete len:276 (+),score=40.85 TRINITY_DN5559_c0_g1_i2:12-839(+)
MPKRKAEADPEEVSVVQAESTSSIENTPFKTPCMLGIDEAGRGPVLGPMVYGCFYCPIAKEKDLKAIGVNDSKKLNEDQRDSQFVKLKDCKWGGYELVVLSAEELSNKMLRREKYNLNLISHDAAAQLIRTVLDKGVNVTHVYVDTVGDAKKYQEKLKRQFVNLEITVCPKADSLYPTVSAASICAKVTRDALLRDWSFAEPNIAADRQFGSGYPSDPHTVSWLKRNFDPVFGFPSLIRFSWGTTKNHLKTAGGCEVAWYAFACCWLLLLSTGHH